MKYKVFESSDTNVKKFVFEWPERKGPSLTVKEAIAEAVLTGMTPTRNEQ